MKLQNFPHIGRENAFTPLFLLPHTYNINTCYIKACAVWDSGFEDGCRVLGGKRLTVGG
jgi:hypothetical protein